MQTQESVAVAATRCRGTIKLDSSLAVLLAVTAASLLKLHLQIQAEVALPRELLWHPSHGAFEFKSVSLSVVVMLGLGGVTRALAVAATDTKTCTKSAKALAVAPIK